MDHSQQYKGGCVQGITFIAGEAFKSSGRFYKMAFIAIKCYPLVGHFFFSLVARIERSYTPRLK